MMIRKTCFILIVLLSLMIGLFHYNVNNDLSLTSSSLLWMYPRNTSSFDPRNYVDISSSTSLSYLRGNPYHEQTDKVILSSQTDRPCNHLQHIRGTNENLTLSSSRTKQIQQPNASNKNISSDNNRVQPPQKYKDSSRSIQQSKRRRLFDVYQFEQREDMVIDTNTNEKRHRDDLSSNYQNDISHNKNTSINQTSFVSTTFYLKLQFSIWFPNWNISGMSKLQQIIQDNDPSNNNNTPPTINVECTNYPIVHGILESFVQLLCRETDLIFLVPMISGTEINYNVTTITTGYTTSSNVSYTEKYYDYCAKFRTNNVTSDEKTIQQTQTIGTTGAAATVRTKSLQLSQTDDILTDNNETESSMYQKPPASKATKVLNAPIVQVRSYSKEGITEQHGQERNTTLNWTTWILSYPILYIGDLYIQETLKDPNFINQIATSTDSDTSSLLRTESTETMKEIVQLAVDVNIIDGTLTNLIQHSLVQSYKQQNEDVKASTTIVPAENDEIHEIEQISTSTVHSAWDIFSNQNHQYCLSKKLRKFTNPFIVYPWHDLRLFGTALLLSTLLLFTFISYMAHERRIKMIKRQESNNTSIACKPTEEVQPKNVPNNIYHTSSEEISTTSMDKLHKTKSSALNNTKSYVEDDPAWLSSHKSVELMLHRSSSFRLSELIEEPENSKVTVNNVEEINSKGGKQEVVVRGSVDSKVSFLHFTG